MPEPWSYKEVDAVVAAYFEMLRMELDGSKYKKADINRNLRDGILSKRSKGSVEFKFMNISAVLKEAGLPWIQGYKPRPNLQQALRGSAIAAAESSGLLSPDDHLPTSDHELLKERVRRVQARGLKSKPQGNRQPEKSTTSGAAYQRDPQVVAWVLDQANGICGLCGRPAPFTDTSGKPFLEVHHIVWLSNGGEDTVENAVALCPNCHRWAHHGEDREFLFEEVHASVK